MGRTPPTHRRPTYLRNRHLKGEADVLSDGGEATEALGPGHALGEIALLLTGKRTVAVAARTPMRLLWSFPTALLGRRDDYGSVERSRQAAAFKRKETQVRR